MYSPWLPERNTNQERHGFSHCCLSFHCSFIKKRIGSAVCISEFAGLNRTEGNYFVLLFLSWVTALQITNRFSDRSMRRMGVLSKLFI